MTLDEAAQFLGISVNATAKEVLEAFRKLALQWHPDRHLDDPRAAERMMQKINEAHAVFVKHLERGGASKTNTGGASRSGNNAGAGTGRTDASSSTSAADDPVVKMYWQWYRNAKREHEKLVNGELATVRTKLTETENELKKILNDSFDIDREKERKCVEELTQLLYKHKLLISQAKLLADEMNRWLKLCNEEAVRFEKMKSQGRK